MAAAVGKSKEVLRRTKNEVKHTDHIVFAPKYGRKVIYKTLRKDVIEIIKKLVKK